MSDPAPLLGHGNGARRSSAWNSRRSRRILVVVFAVTAVGSVVLVAVDLVVGRPAAGDLFVAFLNTLAAVVLWRLCLKRREHDEGPAHCELLPESWTEKSVLTFEEQFMDARSSLSEQQREAAVALFEIGWGAWAVATRLEASRGAVKRLYDRWRTLGGTTLLIKPTRPVFSFEFKLEAVERYRAGEPKVVLAKELGLSSPLIIERWARQYRTEGEQGLRPKPKGRPRKNPNASTQQEAEPELRRLRSENERLRAEVGFLGKVNALRDEGQR